MREEDTASHSSSGDLPLRRSRLVPICLLGAVVGGLAATVLLVNDGRNLQRLSTWLGLDSLVAGSSGPPSVRVGSQTRALPPSRYPAWLLEAGLERSASFEKISAASAEERCRALDPKGAADEWSFSPQDDGSWECLYLQNYGSSAEPASLFVQMRGDEPEGFRSLRMKLSLTDPREEQTIVRTATDFARALIPPMSAETEAYLADHLTRLRAFDSKLEDYRASFGPEMTDPRRYNLIVVARAGPACEDEEPAATIRSITGTWIGCAALPASPFNPERR
jgi:hypothetical protein